MSSKPLITMAKVRMINTRFWNDSFISELDPLDRYLFLYFLTNDKTNICGIYEIPMKTISSETGLELSMIKMMLKRLKGRIDYISGWVIVKNFLKYQNTESPAIKKGIEVEMAKIPKEILKKSGGREMVPIGSIEGVGNLNLNSNLNLNPKNSAVPAEPAPFILKNEIDKLENDKRRDLQVIGLYLSRRKPDIRTKEQLSVTIKRHLRAAKALAPFDDEQIIKAFRKASDVQGWTIETALKILTK